jgi:hypothetical protein
MKTHAIGLRERSDFQEVAPGGNGAGMVDELFSEQGDKQFSVEPRFGALLIVLGEVAKLGNLFETLKDQFDLPPKAIPLQDQFRREILFRESREDHDVLGIEERFRLQLGASLARSASEFF